MRKRIWIPLFVALAVCLLLLFKPKQIHDITSPIPSEATSNQPLVSQSRPAQFKVPKNDQSATAPPPANVSHRPTLTEMTNLQQRLLADWQRPIEFYGKVIDENSNSIADANISFHWMQAPAENGSRSANTKSDAAGLFSLNGAAGPTLAVSVAKEGYYTLRSTSDSFRYDGNESFHPDPLNPVIFHLLKKGVGGSLIAMKRNYKIPRDGAPVSIDLTTGTTVTSESGNFVVQCRTQDAGKHSGEKYDWHCVVSIPGGGAVTNNEEFPFEAPENGYTSSLEISMLADNPAWQDTVELTFYYRLANGLYGRMTFTMVAFGQHFCMIDSVLNPTGSRNLEPQ